MDIALVTGAVGALKTALDIGKTAVTLRDAAKLNEVVIAMNEQLLNAQQSLFMHNAQLMALQQEHFDAMQELRDLKESLKERGHYSLFEIAPGKFVYRGNDQLPNDGGDRSSASPEHYICQPCFDGPSKAKMVLWANTDNYEGIHNTYWICPSCKHTLSTRG